MSTGAIDSLAHVAELIAIMLVAVFSHVKHSGTRKQMREQVVEVENVVRQSVQSLRPGAPGCGACEHAQAAHDQSGCSNRFCGCPGWREPETVRFEPDSKRVPTPPRGNRRAGVVR